LVEERLSATLASLGAEILERPEIEPLSLLQERLVPVARRLDVALTTSR
jgi:hypothetical protein